jgi:hypothetical protein
VLPSLAWPSLASGCVSAGGSTFAPSAEEVARFHLADLRRCAAAFNRFVLDIYMYIIYVIIYNHIQSCAHNYIYVIMYYEYLHLIIYRYKYDIQYFYALLGLKHAECTKISGSAPENQDMEKHLHNKVFLFRAGSNRCTNVWVLERVAEFNLL